MTSVTPTTQQTTATCMAYLKAINPDPSSKKIDGETLSKLLAQDVHLNHQGDTVEGREQVLSFLQKHFEQNYRVVETKLKFEPGCAKITTLNKMNDDNSFETDEVYTVKIEDNNCVITKVVAQQKIILKTSCWIYE